MRRASATELRARPVPRVLLALSAISFAAHALLAQQGIATAPLSAPPPAINSKASASEQTMGAVGPIAIIPIDNKGAVVTGALEVTSGRTMIAASGTVTAGRQTADVILPHRGVLRVCASTKVSLAADTSVPAGEIPGLMIAMDNGAIEAEFAIGRNSDIIMTPDFRILIGGPGAANVKVRLGERGDTCVDNSGVNAPYVLVSSVFDGGAYRVQAGQRVMFQHGSLRAVVDQEKESCGCPPPQPRGNEFPEAQSEGLAPLAKSTPSPAEKSGKPMQEMTGLVYNSADHQPKSAEQLAAPVETSAKPTQPNKKKPGFFQRISRFLRSFAGAG